MSRMQQLQTVSRNKQILFVVAAVALLAGVTAVFYVVVIDSDAGVQQADDAWSTVEQNDSDFVAQLHAEFELDEGEYAVMDLGEHESLSSYEFSVSVTEDKAIRLFVMEREDLDAIEEERRIRWMFEEVGSDFTVSDEILPGDLVLVIDNTAVGLHEPDGDVSGELTIRSPA